jgi:hypothetical protein
MEFFFFLIIFSDITNKMDYRLRDICAPQRRAVLTRTTNYRVYGLASGAVYNIKSDSRRRIYWQPFPGDDVIASHRCL